MRFARRDAILQAAAEDHVSRDQSGPNPRDSWPSWTDSIRFGLAPEPAGRRPQLAADRAPRRAGREGGGR